MILTVTESVLDPDQLARVESFLAEFLPRMRQAPGVVEILHYADRGSGRAQTLVVWEAEADVRAYRESEPPPASRWAITVRRVLPRDR